MGLHNKHTACCPSMCRQTGNTGAKGATATDINAKGTSAKGRRANHTGAIDTSANHTCVADTSTRNTLGRWPTMLYGPAHSEHTLLAVSLPNEQRSCCTNHKFCAVAVDTTKCSACDCGQQCSLHNRAELHDRHSQDDTSSLA